MSFVLQKNDTILYGKCLIGALKEIKVSLTFMEQLLRIICVYYINAVCW